MDGSKTYMDYDVIIPMRNGIEFIGQALNSVMNQTLKPGKIVVVNDHSVDGGPAFVSNNFPTVVLLDSTYEGQAHALNLGLTFSNNRFISFLDADDIWSPNKQEIQIGLLNKHPKMEYVSSGVRNFRDGDKNAVFYQDFLDSRALGACTFRREVFTNLGLFNTEEYSKVFVYEFFSRIKELPRISSNSVEMLRRIHQNNSWITERTELCSSLFRFLRENK